MTKRFLSTGVLAGVLSLSCLAVYAQDSNVPGGFPGSSPDNGPTAEDILQNIYGAGTPAFDQKGKGYAAALNPEQVEAFNQSSPSDDYRQTFDMYGYDIKSGNIYKISITASDSEGGIEGTPLNSPFDENKKLLERQETWDSLLSNNSALLKEVSSGVELEDVKRRLCGKVYANIFLCDDLKSCPTEDQQCWMDKIRAYGAKIESYKKNTEQKMQSLATAKKLKDDHDAQERLLKQLQKNNFKVTSFESPNLEWCQYRITANMKDVLIGNSSHANAVNVTVCFDKNDHCSFAYSPIKTRFFATGEKNFAECSDIFSAGVAFEAARTGKSIQEIQATMGQPRSISDSSTSTIIPNNLQLPQQLNFDGY